LAVRVTGRTWVPTTREGRVGQLNTVNDKEKRDGQRGGSETYKKDPGRGGKVVITDFIPSLDTNRGRSPGRQQRS